MAILPSVEQEARERLVQKLEHLKAQEQYWKTQIALVKEPQREQTTQTIINQLLNNNDQSIHKLVPPEPPKTASVAPLPSDSKFHSLKIERVNLRQKTRHVQYTILKVSYETAFELTVAISSSPLTNEVHGIDAREITPVDAKRELTPLVQTCKASGNILALMHGLSQYAAHLARRNKVFESLCEEIEPLDDLWFDPDSGFCAPGISFEVGNLWVLTLNWQAFFDKTTAEFYTSPSIALSLVDGSPLPDNLRKYGQVFDILVRQRGVRAATVVFAAILRR